MSDGDKKPAAADAASASAAAVPADGEVLKKPGKEAQSAAADERSRPSPSSLSNMRRNARKEMRRK